MRNTTTAPTTVRDLMTSDLVTLTALDSVEQARDVMLTMGIHCLPILSADGQVVGIVTSHDLVDDWQDTELLGDVMTESVVTIDVGARLTEAAQTMKSELIHHLVVVDGRQPIGVLTTFDLLDAFTG